MRVNNCCTFQDHPFISEYFDPAYKCAQSTSHTLERVVSISCGHALFRLLTKKSFMSCAHSSCLIPLLMSNLQQRFLETTCVQILALVCPCYQTPTCDSDVSGLCLLHSHRPRKQVLELRRRFYQCGAESRLLNT